MLRVTEYFAKSCKITENGTVPGYGFLFAYHGNYGRIFSRFDTIHERDSQPATARRHRPRLGIAPRGKMLKYGFRDYHSQAEDLFGQ